MLNFLKYRFRLFKLKKTALSLSKQYDKIKNKHEITRNDFEYLQELARQEHDVEIYIDFIKTNYYRELCNELVLPMPKKEEGVNYYIHNFDDLEGDRYILTIEGMHCVRSLIRNERKARRYSLLDSFIWRINRNNHWVNFHC